MSWKNLYIFNLFYLGLHGNSTKGQHIMLLAKSMLFIKTPSTVVSMIITYPVDRFIKVIFFQVFFEVDEEEKNVYVHSGTSCKIGDESNIRFPNFFSSYIFLPQNM